MGNVNALRAGSSQCLGAVSRSGAVPGVDVMDDYIVRRMFFPALVFAFGSGFFLGFVTAVYAAISLFGTASISG